MDVILLSAGYSSCTGCFSEVFIYLMFSNMYNIAWHIFQIYHALIMDV